MASVSKSVELHNPDETTAFASALGGRLVAGDVLLLQGDVGAGKTHFARALIQSLLDEPEDVPSPTFTLVQTYETRKGALWHSDLYRLSSPFEVDELGLTEAFETAICLIEWPDRLGDMTPPDALTLTLTPLEHDTHRALQLTWNGGGWGHKLAGLIE